MNDEHLDWKPRIPSHKRLAADPADWSAYGLGDQIGVFVGNCWRKGSIIELHGAFATVKAKRLGSSQSTEFNVHDARNVCPVRDLTRPERDHSTPLLEEGE